jgi:tripartite-type tricarboxylate transporter receptor subunit TctC
MNRTLPLVFSAGRPVGFFALLWFLSIGPFAIDTVDAQLPQKPITLITPFAAGGSSDLTARVFTTYLNEYLGQPMLIKLVPGLAGQKGTL